MAQSQAVYTTVNPRAFGSSSNYMICPACNKQINTDVVTEASTKTHLIALFLFVLGCWPCCFIPYCKDSCQSQKHYCPHCKALLGTYDNYL